MTGNSSSDKRNVEIDFGASDVMKVPMNAGILELPGKFPVDREYASYRKIETFFTDLIASELSREQENLSQESFSCLKIWLYNTTQPRCLQRYQVPLLDKRDLEIHSPIALSKLERIYVLDNGFSGAEYELWKASCEALFEPLFRRFIAPQEPPEVLKDFMVMRFGESLSSKLYLYLEMQKNMFFDALVIQTS